MNVFEVGQVLYLPLRVSNNGTVVPTGSVHKPVIEIKHFNRTYYTFDISTVSGQRMIVAWPEDILMEVNPVAEDTKPVYKQELPDAQIAVIRELYERNEPDIVEDGNEWYRLSQESRNSGAIDVLEEAGHILSKGDNYAMGRTPYLLTPTGQAIAEHDAMNMVDKTPCIQIGDSLHIVYGSTTYTDDWSFDYKMIDGSEGHAERSQVVDKVTLSNMSQYKTAFDAWQKHQSELEEAKADAEYARHQRWVGVETQRVLRSLGLFMTVESGDKVEFEIGGKQFTIRIKHDLSTYDYRTDAFMVIVSHADTASDGEEFACAENVQFHPRNDTDIQQNRASVMAMISKAERRVGDMIAEHEAKIANHEPDPLEQRGHKTRFVSFEQYDNRDVARAEHKIDELRRQGFRPSGITGDATVTVMMTRHITPDAVKRKMAEHDIFSQAADFLGDDLDEKGGEPANTQEKMIISHEPVGAIDAQMFSDMLNKVAMRARRLPMYNDHRVTTELLQMSARFSTVAKQLEKEGVLTNG